MLKLSDRLQIIADRLDNCKTMIDVGTDHGFLPVFMVESGRCDFAIAADISEPSLAKARQLVSESGVNVECRAGDGLAVVNPGEVEGLVIAGMGGTLITEILEANIEVVMALKTIVLQPRTATGELRRWLMDNKFAITAEDTVIEGKFIPEIITCVPPVRLHCVEVDCGEGKTGTICEFDCNPDYVNLADMGVEGSAELFFEVPPWVMETSGPVKEHVRRVLKRERSVHEGLLRANNRDNEKILRQEEAISYLENLIEQLPDDK